MREVIIQVYCEFCWLEDSTKTLATQTWTVGMKDASVVSPPIKMLDVCEQHGVVLDRVYDVFQAAAAGDVDPKHSSGKGKSPTSGASRQAKVKPPRLARGPVKAKHADKLEVCPLCGNELVKLSGLINHIWTRHVPGGRPAVEACEHCGDKFKSNQGLASHLRVYHPPYDPLAEALNAVPDTVKVTYQLSQAS